MVKMSFLERIIKIQMCNSLTSYKKYFHMYRYLVRVPLKSINWGIFQIIFCGDDCSVAVPVCAGGGGAEVEAEEAGAGGRGPGLE